MKIKEKLFRRFLEKPINDILLVSYEMYRNSCLVYLDELNIPTLEEYSTIINDKLKNLYNGGDD